MTEGKLRAKGKGMTKRAGWTRTITILNYADWVHVVEQLTKAALRLAYSDVNDTEETSKEHRKI